MNRLLISLAALAVLAQLPACQKRNEPVQIPTMDQWRRIQENVTTTEPPVQFRIDAEFESGVRLVGWSVEPAELESGKDFRITLIWQATAPIADNWKMYIHIDGGSARQNLDHQAIGDVYPTTLWKPGDYIRDEVRAQLDPSLPSGELKIYAGLFRDDKRMAVTAPGQGRTEADGRLFIGTTQARWLAPSLEARKTATPIVIDGRASDRAWSSAPRSEIWKDPRNGDAVEGGDTWAKATWDDSNLYLLMSANDTDIWSTMAERDANLWEEEVLEVYIDSLGNGTQYLELQVNPLGTVFDAVFASADNRDLAAARAVNVPGLETAVSVNGTLDNREDNDRSWTVEIKVPFSSLPAFATTPPTDASELRVNFYRYNRGKSADPITAAWSPVGGGTFHLPERFGRLVLKPSRVGAPRAADGSGEGSGAQRLRQVPPMRGARPSAAPSPDDQVID